MMAEAATTDVDPSEFGFTPQSVKPAAGKDVPWSEFTGAHEQPVDAKNIPPVSASERFWHGVDDPLNAAAQMLANAVPNKIVSELQEKLPSWIPKSFVPTGQELNKQIATSNSIYDQARKNSGQTGVDWWRLAGNIGGTAPVMATLPFAAPETFSGAALSGVGTGVLTGALNPVADDGSNFWDKKINQGEVGALIGGAFGPLSHAASRILSPQPSEATALLQSKGVAPTIGQIGGGFGNTLEQKLTSWIPGFGDMIKAARGRAVDDFNKAVYNEALEPIGEKFDQAAANVGHEGVKQVGDKLSKAYGELLPNLTFRADPQFTQELSTVKSMIPYAAPDKVATMNKIIENEVESKLSPNGIMDGESYKRMESELNNQIRKYSGDPSGDSRDIADALKTILKAARENLARSNPDAADQLSGINRGWAVLARIEKAASGTGTSEGVFSPAQFSSAVKWGDNTVRDRASARGEAFMQKLADAGKGVLGNSVPDSGTAGRIGAGVALSEGAMHAPEIAQHVAAHPIAATALGVGAGLTTLPYTPWGQRAISALASQRTGKVLPALAAGVNRAALPLQTGAVFNSGNSP